MTNWFVEQFWEKCLYYFSSETSQKFLWKKYELLGFEKPREKSYANCRTFIFYLEQGKSFFAQARTAPENIKPILIFYGLSFVIKAILLTIDPDYPATTSVLAHGVSTRKRKKQNYRYFQDEVKIQKHGLFPYFALTLFRIKGLEGKKFSISSLLKQIPELHVLFNKWYDDPLFIKVKKEQRNFILPDDILDVFKMTEKRLSEFLQQKTVQTLSLKSVNKQLIITYSNHSLEKHGEEILPFRYNLSEDAYYFIKELNSLTLIPEIMIHYLLLYHLSMLARYEVEWWSELIHYKEGFEYPVISHYLQICSGKCLFLLNEFLLEST